MSLNLKKNLHTLLLLFWFFSWQDIEPSTFLHLPLILCSDTRSRMALKPTSLFHTNNFYWWLSFSNKPLIFLLCLIEKVLFPSGPAYLVLK